MELHFKVKLNGKIINFNEAVRLNYIEIIDNGLRIKDGIEVNRSTDLFDENLVEIFEKDILENNSRSYLVEYFPGTFFINNIRDKKGCIPLALSGLSNNNRIKNLKIR